GVRRTILHAAMTERARELGVELLWGAVVAGLADDGVMIGGRKVRARSIVGADGGNSRVRRWAGLETGRRKNSRYAFRRHYRTAPWTNRMEVYWSRNAQAYIAAVSEDQVCVAVASHDPKMRLENVLQELPELRERLAKAETVSTEKGAVT